MFCSNCGFKFINDGSSSSAKAKNLAEEKMNAMLSKMSLKSLKDFNWLSEKEAMYGLPTDNKQKIKYFKMKQILLSPKGINLSQTGEGHTDHQNDSKSPKTPKSPKNPKSPIRSKSPKSPIRSPMNNPIEFNLCTKNTINQSSNRSNRRPHTANGTTNASQNRFLPNIISAIEEHYEKINGNLHERKERKMMMQKKIFLTNIIEHKSAGNIEENSRKIKSMIGMEDRNIRSRESLSRFGPYNSNNLENIMKDIGDVSHYLNDVGSIKDIYQNYVERERLHTGLVRSPHENNSFDNNNRFHNNNGFQNNGIENNGFSNNGFDIENNQGFHSVPSTPAFEKRDFGAENIRKYNENNNIRNLDPGSAYPESWFWGPKVENHCDIGEGDYHYPQTPYGGYDYDFFIINYILIIYFFTI